MPADRIHRRLGGELRGVLDELAQAVGDPSIAGRDGDRSPRLDQLVADRLERRIDDHVERHRRTLARREVFTLRDSAVPLLRLTDAFNMTDSGGQAPSPVLQDRKWFVVVTRAGDKSIGILVDALVRQQEIVIKAIGERLKNVPGVAGATEIGEGEIVLVVDAASLIERFGGKARQARAAVNV